MVATRNYEIHEQSGRRYLLLTGAWTHDVAAAMRENGIKNLRLSHYTSWRGKTIEFLQEVPFLEGLELWATGIKDVNPLYELRRLRSLSLNMVTRPIDFRRFPVLEDLTIAGYQRVVDFSAILLLRRLNIGNWRASLYSGVFHAKQLHRLTITGYRGSDLHPFHELTELQELGLADTAVQSLAGAPAMFKLQRLALTLANRLRDLQGLGECVRLRDLLIEKARELERIDAVSKLIELRELGLSDCPSIATIRPIQGLIKLKAVYLLGTTRIGDGDLSVLKSLPHLQHASFADRKNYSHKSAEFPKSYHLHGKSVLPDSSARI